MQQGRWPALRSCELAPVKCALKSLHRGLSAKTVNPCLRRQEAPLKQKGLLGQAGRLAELLGTNLQTLAVEPLSLQESLVSLLGVGAELAVDAARIVASSLQHPLKGGDSERAEVAIDKDRKSTRLNSSH